MLSLFRSSLEAYGHGHALGSGGLFYFLVHAAVWAVVSRVIYSIPLPIAVLVVSVLALVYVRRRRSSRALR